MKILPEHYKTMQTMILSKFDKEKIMQAKEEYKKQELSDMRFRWDLWRATQGRDYSFTCETLYTYLNDDHIDTALKAIVCGILQ